MLDGDHRCSKLKLFELSASQQKSAVLKDHIKAVIGADVTFYPPEGDLSAQECTLVLMMQQFGEYWDSMVVFLPQDTPEELIWSSELASVELESVIGPDAAEEKLSELAGLSHAKARVLKLTEAVYGDATEHYRSMCAKFLRRWIYEKGDEYREVTALVRGICESG